MSALPDIHGYFDYREWLLAIQDTLDEEIDETAYHNELIQKVFTIIERDTLTPQERARMKDEYGYEQIGQDQFAKGQTQGKQETALAMLQERKIRDVPQFNRSVCR